MQPPFDPWLSSTIAADVATTRHAGSRALAERQQRRLAALIGSALHRSPLYRHLLKGAEPQGVCLSDMPIVHKAELMSRFDQWCTDPAIRLEALRGFVAEPANIGRAFLDRYVVWESSGSTGEPAIFVQDAAAMAVYDALEALRKPDLAPVRHLLDPWGLGERIVFVGAVGGHFASTVSLERIRLLNPMLADKLASVSFLQPIERVVAALHRLAPTVVATYPSAAVVLADEALAGRLRITPRELWTGGETLSLPMRSHVERAFGCRVVNSYGASEFLTLGCECAKGSLHLNCDWAILEPVDEHGGAVAAGSFGATTLLTNLANHVQPLIRYDLGDQVALHAEACACGSPLPLIEVRGRSDDTLHVRARSGQELALLPLALSTVIEEGAGLYDFQLVQDGPAELSLSTAGHGAEASRSVERARSVLAAYLHEQGAAKVRIDCHCGQAPRIERSGKRQRVIDGRRI
jgi:phenylacetate-coenzyme A ligase PaaK-like adenylate-forming protein